MRRNLRNVFCLAFMLSAPVAGQEDVDIYYDKEMVAHIFGATDEGAMYGLGYHHMREYPLGTLDALWFSSGRMAEIAGECYLKRDKKVHLWEVPAIADRHEAEMGTNDPEILAMLQAYVLGVEDGRAWWIANPDALEELVGGALEMYVDPLPGYLNIATGPMTAEPVPKVAIENILYERLFSASATYAITLDHVLRLGVSVNSGPGLLYGDNRGNPCIGESGDEREVLGSNGWMLATGESEGPIVHSGIHTVWDRLHLRMGFSQVHGEEFQAFGPSVPGLPAIILGFNDWIAWGITATPTPPIAGNVWQVTLTSNPNLKYIFGNGNQVFLHTLQQVTTSLGVYNPSNNTSASVNYTRCYAPEPNTALGLPNNRYPVIVPDSIEGNLPTPSTMIQFGQLAFAVEGNPLEFWLKLGRARDVRDDVDEIFDSARSLFGDGDNWFFADRDGYMRYIVLSRVPVPGSGVTDPTQVLAGNNANKRWAGYYPWEDSPQIDAVAPEEAEAWIINNCSPDLVSPDDHPIDLGPFPDHIAVDATITTWRQDWARELFDPPTIDVEESQAAAIDETDIWMLRMWEYFEEVAQGLDPEEPSAKFVEWVNDHRHLDECDEFDAAYDFVAHPMSQVTVWTTLLRYFYMEKLESLEPDAPADTFGTDPRHPLFDEGPAGLADPDYDDNVEAMLWALAKISDPTLSSAGDPDVGTWYAPSGLWYLGSGPGGLANPAVLEHWSACMDTPADPWGENSDCTGHACGSGSRYEDDIECASPNGEDWAEYLPWDRVVRWGHVNLLSLTAHSLALASGRSGVGQCLQVLGIATALQTRPLPSADAPCDPDTCSDTEDRMDCLPNDCSNSVGVFFSAHRPIAAPIGGTSDSLFTQRAFNSFSVGNYLDSIYRWEEIDDDPPTYDHLYYNNVDQGNHVLYTVQLTPEGAVGSYMAVAGSTEITRVHPDDPVDHELSYQDRFAPTPEFVGGKWRDAVTDEATLIFGDAHLVTITYDP